MDYFRIIDDIHADQRWHLGGISSPEGVVDACAFTSGKVFDLSTALSVSVSEGISFDFTLADFDVPIVSATVAAILQDQAADQIQLVPIELANSEEVGDHWFIVNVLKKIPCIDDSRSVFTKWEDTDGRADKVGDYRMVPKLVIDTKKVSGADVFRIAGWDVPLVISDSIRQKFIACGVTGAVFQKIT